MKRGKQFRDDEFIQLLAARLRELCEAKGIKHEKLAEKAGFDTRQIGRILRGESNTSISHFAQVCRALEMHPSEVLEGVSFKF
ncbi:helix-turn-helix transcriptional regulator [Fulvivirga maritima]|uniref:helix-turn-helix domain-containing protein n=1 Tax=Fulvivirga maritima TaxID=2904247 RepID=UPI001F27BBEC|nr:helix-turn-helix transcriptional regulator [Fulvivirga maritima]UII29101.1 helix-turn-helix transcriptional regulator [Fulvivirga maritima]